MGLELRCRRAQPTKGRLRRDNVLHHQSLDTTAALSSRKVETRCLTMKRSDPPTNLERQGGT